MVCITCEYRIGCGYNSTSFTVATNPCTGCRADTGTDTKTNTGTDTNTITNNGRVYEYHYEYRTRQNISSNGMFPQ
jgi:hypothetical protein